MNAMLRNSFFPALLTAVVLTVDTAGAQSPPAPVIGVVEKELVPILGVRVALVLRRVNGGRVRLALVLQPLPILLHVLLV